MADHVSVVNQLATAGAIGCYCAAGACTPSWMLERRALQLDEPRGSPVHLSEHPWIVAAQHGVVIVEIIKSGDFAVLQVHALSHALHRTLQRTLQHTPLHPRNTHAPQIHHKRTHHACISYAHRMHPVHCIRHACCTIHLVGIGSGFARARCHIWPRLAMPLQGSTAGAEHVNARSADVHVRHGVVQAWLRRRAACLRRQVPACHD